MLGGALEGKMAPNWKREGRGRQAWELGDKVGRGSFCSVCLLPWGGRSPPP